MFLIIFFVDVLSLLLDSILFSMPGVVYNCWLINGDINRRSVRGGH